MSNRRTVTIMDGRYKGRVGCLKHVYPPGHMAAEKILKVSFSDEHSGMFKEEQVQYGCMYCTDPDGNSCYPVYGPGPVSDLGNFTPDPADPTMGTYSCPACGSGAPTGFEKFQDTCRYCRILPLNARKYCTHPKVVKPGCSEKTCTLYNGSE